MSDSRVRVPHVVKGERVTGADCVHGREGERFATPELDLNSLVWPRSIPVPRSTFRSLRSSTCWLR